jgi:hypothetical protein
VAESRVLINVEIVKIVDFPFSTPFPVLSFMYLDITFLQADINISFTIQDVFEYLLLFNNNKSHSFSQFPLFCANLVLLSIFSKVVVTLGFTVYHSRAC